MRLSVVQQIPEAPMPAITAEALAQRTGLAVRDVVATLNALADDGLATRRVPGDGKQETPVARWIRAGGGAA